MLKQILKDLMNGNIQPALDCRVAINNIAVDLLNKEELSPEEVDQLDLLIRIGNSSYGNYPTEMLPIEDGIYDLLVVKMQKIDYNRFQVGTQPVKIQTDSVPKLNSEVAKVTYPFIIPSKQDIEKMNSLLYPSIIDMNKPMMREDVMIKPFKIQPDGDYVRQRNTKHSFPHLVGTLEKCKFVLDKQAEEVGKLNTANVKIFERDFMVPVMHMGLIDQYRPIQMVATLKYDGVSVEADVTSKIEAARTRGDTDLDQATDLTPILKGYEFPRAKDIQFEYPIGMKFEAIITNMNLRRLNQILGTNYINGRTAIIGLLGRLDAYKYRDFITLVPLQVDFGDGPRMNRVQELEFLNKYFTTIEYIRYVVFEAPFNQLMFQIKQYAQEAEYVRQFMPFMYDGVVLEFLDETIRATLGRKNHINQYAMAIKFNPLKKQTIFRGYAYTIGKNGQITPMIYYDPVEFMGAIHNHSTGSSYQRFQNLDLHIGDLVDVTYTNDVMPYVTKPDNSHNRENALKVPAEVFPENCPCCGTKLVFSKSGKSVVCPNLLCTEALRGRLTDMMNYLNLVGFSEESVAALPHITSFRELMECSEEDFEVLGPNNKVILYNMIQEVKNIKYLPDYILMAALGFSNIGKKTWKKILSTITLEQLYEIYNLGEDGLRVILVGIKGIGPTTADTIIQEMQIYAEDIKYIIEHVKYTQTPFGIQYNAIVRFSGFRSPELEQHLAEYDIDADGNAGVTQDTNLLIATRMTGGKIDNAKKYGIPIVTLSEFKANEQEYLKKWGCL